MISFSAHDESAVRPSCLEPRKRAHFPQLAAGLASVSKNGKLPYGRRSLQLAAGIFNPAVTKAPSFQIRHILRCCRLPRLQQVARGRRKPGLNPIFLQKLCGISLTGRELYKTSESDNYEVFGAPMRAKRTAHLSGQIASCLRPLGRVLAI